MNNRTAIAAALALSLTLCACGHRDASDAKPTAATGKMDKPVPLKDRDPVAYKSSLGSVMSQVKPEEQADYQSLLTCTIKRGAAAGQPVIVNAQMAGSVLQRLRKDPKALEECSTL